MFRALIVGIALGVLIDLACAWIWLAHYDGPEFPY